MAGEYRHIAREFGPVFDASSRILILGSFPSAKSREVNFYYGHPQNRFWPLMARLLEAPLPQTTEEKRALMLTHHIALWDSIDSWDIIGSSDSSIKNAVPVEIELVLNSAAIRQIYANGTASAKVYSKFLFPRTGREIIPLPSTSPANAAWNMDRLFSEWQQILPALAE